MIEEPLCLESLKTLATDDSGSGEELYNALSRALQQNSSTEPAEAARQISNLIPSRQPGDTDITYGESVEGFLWAFWGLIIGVAKLIPRGHSRKPKLILIMKELSQISTATVNIWDVRMHTYS